MGNFSQQGKAEQNEYPLKQRLLETYDPALSTAGVNGERIAERLHQLAQIGLTEQGGSSRMGFSPEERAAKERVKDWMREAGLNVHEDGAGNVFGRLEGTNQGAKAILSGSHVDSVPNGGHFDGPLGVLAALEVVEAWRETGYTPQKPFEVVIFTDEEGSRFKGGLLGSQAMVGETAEKVKEGLVDDEGRSFAEVLELDGLSVDSYRSAKRDLTQIETFVEVHIEQGKRLEKANVPVGVVTGIAGPCWMQVTFKGQAGHAGNTPMDDRQDALVAAGSFIQEIHHLPAQISPSAVATVGQMFVYPNGVNVIPGSVKLTVDIRDIHASTRDELVKRIQEVAERVANEYRVEVEWQETLRVDPVPIAEEWQRLLAEAICESGFEPFYLPSGAGHDAMIVGRHIPVAMLFVRSKDGISHNPKEWTSLNDIVHGVHVLKRYIEKLNR